MSWRRAALAGLALGLAADVRAAALAYDPEQVSVRTLPGSAFRTELAVGLAGDAEGSFHVRFLGAVLHGNLPRAWLETRDATAMLDGSWPTAVTELVIRVPADAVPGAYTGFLMPEARAAHGIADPGGGVYLEVIVLSPPEGE